MCAAPKLSTAPLQVRAAKEDLELALPELQFVVHPLKALEELDTTGQTRAAPRHEEVDRMYDLRLQFASSAGGRQRACRLLMQRSPRTSSMSAMSGRGSGKLLKLLSDHNVSD